MTQLSSRDLIDLLAQDEGWEVNRSENDWLILRREGSVIVCHAKKEWIWVAKEDHSSLYGTRYEPNEHIFLEQPRSIDRLKDFFKWVLRLDKYYNRENIGSTSSASS